MTCIFGMYVGLLQSMLFVLLGVFHLCVFCLGREADVLGDANFRFLRRTQLAYQRRISSVEVLCCDVMLCCGRPGRSAVACTLCCMELWLC